MLRITPVVSLCIALCLAPSLAAAPGERSEAAPSKALELPDRPFDRAGHLRQMKALQGRLSESIVPAALELELNVIVTPQERASVSENANAERKVRVGLVKDLDIPLTFERGNRSRLRPALGAVRENADRTFDWSGAVRSEGAAALRIQLTDFDLGEGAELYVLTRSMAYGPYSGLGPNGSGEFWTDAVAGDQVILQLRGQSGGAPRFTISGLGYMTEAFKIAPFLAPPSDVAAMADTSPCGNNAPCVFDAACATTTNAVDTAKLAVAQMLFVSGAYYYLCSGGLVADSDASSAVPYFITANHCISRAGEASSLQTFFFFATQNCNGACPEKGAANTNGASIVSMNKSSDYTLLRLSGNAPSGAAFLGWSATPVANTNGTDLYRISHPLGAPQSYSQHRVDTSKPTCRSWPRGPWIYSRDIVGATEGGSSGSPVVNGTGQLVGQLSGGCGTNVNDECDSVRNATVDGAFANYYTTVAPWLGPGGGGTCTDADGDGHCSIATGGDDCNDNNKNVYPGHSDKGKWGRDGVDNDCNGKIDG